MVFTSVVVLQYYDFIVRVLHVGFLVFSLRYYDFIKGVGVKFILWLALSV